MAYGTYAGGLVNPGGPVSGGVNNGLGNAQNDFVDALRRGQAGGSAWGGALTFDGNGGGMYNGQHVDANSNIGYLASQDQSLMNRLGSEYGYQTGGNDISAQTYGWQGIQPNAAPQGDQMGGSGSGAPAGGGNVINGAGGAQFGTSNGTGTSNPYLQDQANWLRQDAQNNYDRVTAPQIRYGAAAGGGYGGSRMGVMEANAQNDMNRGVNSAIAGLLGNNWQQDQSRQVNSRDSNRNMDLSQAALGASLYGQGMQGQQGLNAGAYGVGQTQQQAPWQTIGAAGGAYSPFTGLGSSSTQTSQQGGGLQGALGGLLGGAQLANNAGLFRGIGNYFGGSSAGWGTGGGGGFGTGLDYGNVDFGAYL